MKNYTQFKKRLLKNRAVRTQYEALNPEFEMITLLIKKRLQRGLTQKDLARRIGTKQASISRFESGTYNPSLGFMYKIADALNARLKISVGAK